MTDISGQPRPRETRNDPRDRPVPRLPHRAASWLEAINTVLDLLEREQAGSKSPIVDHEARVNLDSATPEISIRLICRNRAEQRVLTDTELPRNVASLRAKMARLGFPEDAIAGLIVKVTSRDEIEAEGGRVSFR